ncbi:MAG: FecR family protein [Limisphaerales bacterium]
MKKLCGGWKSVAALGASAFALGFLATASAEQATAKVQAIPSGSAQYSSSGGSWLPLQAGAVLSQGSTVKTDGAGVVDLYLGKNGPWVRLSPDTSLSLSTLLSEKGVGEAVTSTELNLASGRAVCVVRKMSAGARYSIKTASATCNILGTKVNASARGQFAIKDGFAEVFYTAPGASAPTKFNVGSGYTFEPSVNGGKGGVIGTPAELAAELEQGVNALAGDASVAGIGYAPNPEWLRIQDPFAAPGQEAQVFAIPPVQNPTTPVESQ